MTAVLVVFTDAGRQAGGAYKNSRLWVLDHGETIRENEGFTNDKKEHSSENGEI